MPVVAVGVASGLASAAAGITIAGASVLASAVAIGVGTALGTQLLSDAMMPEMGSMETNPVTDQALTTQGNQVRKIVYGKALVGGQIVGYAKPTIGDKEYHIMVLHLVGHPCESVEVYEIEGKKLSEFGSKASVNIYLGDQTAADNLAKTHIEGWTSNHIGTNQTYVVVKVENDPNLVSGSINEMKFVVKGHRVYDPRKDDTAGGSGAHRVDDQATWEWSDNPMLCAYHALLTSRSKGVPQRRFPWDFVAVCANYTDELATYRDKDGNEQQGQRFACNGVLNNGMRPNELLNQIMLTMGAKLYRVGGRVFIKPAMYAGPAVTTIHVKDLRELPKYNPHRKYSELTNFIRPEYVEPELKWQVTSAPVVTSEAYRLADKAHLESTIRANMVTKSHQIQRLAKLQLERNRAGFVTSYSLDGLRLDVAAGNVIRFVDPQSGIDKEFLVATTDFDTAKRRTNLTLTEDGPQLYPEGFEPAEGDLTPNTSLPDATAPIAPLDVSFVQTPSDSWRQGRITWSHPSPNSVINFIVKIGNDAGFQRTFAPVELEQSLSNVPLGDYTLEVGAINRYGKQAFSSPLDITISSTPTPAGVTTQVLTGKLIVTGPPLPHDGATYDWRYAFDGVFATSYDGGRNVSLTVTNTPQDGTVTIWYRLIDGERADPNWTSFQIGGLLSETIYTWIRYADDASGNGLSGDPTGKTYIGFAYNKPVPVPSNNAADYTWGLMTTEGIPGAPGADGVTTYTWIRYADNAAGTINFSNTPLATTQYIGLAHNQTTETESDDPEDYVWANFKGDQGPQGVPGAPGADGQTTYTWIKYADNASGSGLSNDPSGKAYIGFAYNKNTPSESNAPGDYTWSLVQGPQGDTGVPGAPGTDGQTTYTWIKYSANPDGSGLTDLPQSNTAYIGIAVNKTSASESNTPGDYVWSRWKGDQGPQGVPGAPGADGTTTYTWIRYADDASGSGISNDPTGKQFIGLAHNKTSQGESNVPGDYTWARITGEGVQGPPGADGQTTYTWIKYSANADGTGLTDAPQSNTAYIGISPNRTTPTESTNKADYVWSRWKGEQGETGAPGDPGQDGADGAAAPNIIPASGALKWYFQNDNNGGWVPYNSTFDYGTDTLIVNGTSGGQYIVRNSLAPFSGRNYYAIVVKVRCLDTSYSTTASLYYNRSGDGGYSGSRRKGVSVKYVQGEYTYLVFDMRDDSTYTSANIIGLRVDPGSNTHDWEFDQIWVGYSGAPDETNYEDERVANSRIDAGWIDDRQGWAGNRPAPGANRTTNTNQLTDGANLGLTANWGNVTGSGRPANNADVTDYYNWRVNNDRFEMSDDGYMTYRDGSNNSVNLGRVTRSGIGAESPSGAQARADAAQQAAYNQALASELLRNPSGEGINFLPPMYFDPRPGIPLASKANLSGSDIYESVQNWPGDTPANIQCAFRLAPNTDDGYMYLSDSQTNYNMTLVPNQRWLVSWYSFRNISSGNASHPRWRMFIKTESGSHVEANNLVTDGEWQRWTRYQVLIDLRSHSDRKGVLRIGVKEAPGQQAYCAGLMVEVYKGEGSVLSPLRPPLGAAPLLRSRLLPTSNNMGIPAAANTNSLSSNVDPGNSNLARIDIAAHTVKVSNEDISYGSGTVYGLNQGTQYHIYCFDPYGVGGNVSYYATTNGSSLAQDGIYTVGKFTTYVSGGGETRPPPGDCPHAETWLTPTLQAKDAKVGDVIDAVTNGVKHKAPIIGISPATEDVITFTTVSGNEVTVSLYTPVDMRDGSSLLAVNVKRGDEMLAEMPDGALVWEPVVDRAITEAQPVMHISLGGTNFLGGVSADKRLVTHNIFYKP